MPSIAEIIESKREVKQPAKRQPPQRKPPIGEPPEAEFLEIVEIARNAVEVLGECHAKLTALGMKTRTVDGLSSPDPVRLAGTLIRRDTAHLNQNARAFAHPRQGWDVARRTNGAS